MMTVKELKIVLDWFDDDAEVIGWEWKKDKSVFYDLMQACNYEYQMKNQKLILIEVEYSRRDEMVVGDGMVECDQCGGRFEEEGISDYDGESWCEECQLQGEKNFAINLEDDIKEDMRL